MMPARSAVTRLMPVLFGLLFVATIGRGQPDMYSAPDKQWFTLDTKHFMVHYHEGAERTAQAVAKIAEEVYGPITSLYGHEPDSKVSFVIKDLSDYSNGGAYFFNNKIELWASPLDFELRGSHNWLRNVICHEFTHIVQMQSSMKFGRLFPAITLQWFGYEKERRSDVLFGYPNTLVSYPIPSADTPPWMAEGTAQYMRRELGYESWDSHRDMILRMYVLEDSMLTWQEMQAFGKTSLGNESVYNAGYAFTRFIAHTYGEQAIIDLTRALAKPFVFTSDGAFKSALGKSGKLVYEEWKKALKSEYAARMAPVLAKTVEGRILTPVGFANLYPVPSPDGSRLAYTSNTNSDYFGQSSVYLHTWSTGGDTLIAERVHSALSWSPGGDRILFSRANTPTVHGQFFEDLHEYNLVTKEERRVTEGLRAKNPAYSPDGHWIAFAYARDGSVNIGVVDSAGGRFRAVTSYTYGEQVFTPQWSPDGKTILFGLATRDGRSIASVPFEGGAVTRVITGDGYDCRDARFSRDGKTILYAADRTGIFNIYRFDLAAGKRTQLTNVRGGAFMPADDASGRLTFAQWMTGGYKIAVLEGAADLALSNNDYLPATDTAVVPAKAPAAAAWDWEMLRSYDDTKLNERKPRSYSRVFQQMMLFPTLRLDAYNPENKGIELFKPGLMFASSDIMNRMELLAAASLNVRGERDLYLSVTYRDRLPLLTDLGAVPDVSLDVYNVTRKTRSELQFPIDTVGVDVGYNLLEFAARVRHHIIDNNNSIEFGYRHSRYTSTLGSYTVPETGLLVAARDNLYLIGNEISMTFRSHGIDPARDADINPTGYKFTLKYDLSLNRFNPNGDYDYDASSGMIIPKYQNFNFSRIETQLTTGMRLPYWSHTLSMRLHFGTILGPAVDDFFSFYAGGLSGMQGYTYYSIGGNELASMTLTYRFPIFSSMDFSLGHILFDKFYGSVFVDVGDAVPSTGQYTLRNLKKDVGFELRLESFSFSMYPTRIFFSGAYGIDRFTRTFNSLPVTYGREWRWYFGVLFDFDLSDGLRMR
jgi:Tol biopolymer transport system component